MANFSIFKNLSKCLALFKPIARQASNLSKVPHLSYIKVSNSKVQGDFSVLAFLGEQKMKDQTKSILRKTAMFSSQRFQTLEKIRFQN